MGKFPSGHGEGRANEGWSVRERPGACYPLIESAVTTSTSNENACAIDPEGPMKLPVVKGMWWKPTLTVPATAGLRDLIGREKGAMTADEGLFRRQVPKEWLPALSDSIPSILFP